MKTKHKSRIPVRIRSKRFSIFSLLLTGSVGLCNLSVTQAAEFATGWTDPVGGNSSTSWFVALGDVDNDDDLDAWVTDLSDSKADRIMLNDGSGNFTAGFVINDNDNDETSYGVDFGDLDGDLDLDAVVVNGAGATVVWVNDGNGNFSKAQTFDDAANNSFNQSVSLGYIDNDNSLDIWIAASGANRVWLNNGSGVFTDSGQVLGSQDSRSVVLGDLNKDGHLDAWVANNGGNVAWINDGTGVFSSQLFLGDMNSRSVALGDIDNDNDLDAWVANSSGDSSNQQAAHIWLNNGQGQFSDAGAIADSGNSVAVAMADLDTDGDLDAWAVGDWNGEAGRVWLNDGTGAFTLADLVLGGNHKGAVAFGDLDGDGDSDAWVATYFGVDQVWKNTQVFRVIETEGSTEVTEGGASDSLSIVLTHPPGAGVSIDMSIDTQLNLGSGSGATHSVTFSTSNWDIPQSVTVTATDDAVAEGLHTSVISFISSSSSANENGFTVSDISVAISDNDNLSILVTPNNGLTTSETGDNDTFTVALTSKPTASVTIGLSSSDEDEGIADASSLVFTTANWNTPQAVTVTGQDDDIVDVNQGYTILTTAVTSNDPNYSGLEVDDVTVINTDNDTAGIIVTVAEEALVTTEAGGTVQFDVVLMSEPSVDVSVNLSSSNDEGSTDTPSLTFTAENWDVAQTVTVTGLDDLIEDGDQAYSIITVASSNDPDYDAIDVDDIALSNTDDDVAQPVGAGATTHIWQIINTGIEDLNNPVVIVGPPTYRGTDPGVLRINNVTASHFNARFSEWTPGNGRHLSEHFSYLMAGEGIYTQPDGSIWEIGSFTASGTADWQPRPFVGNMPGIPAVFLTAQTSAGGQAVTVRARKVTQTGFEAALFEEEARMDGHIPERIGYLAVYSPSGSGMADLGAGEQPYLLQKAAVSSRLTPVLTANLKMEEDQSKDAETKHLAEQVDVLALGQQLFAQDVSSFGANTAALRQMAAEDTAKLEWGVVNSVTHNWVQVPFSKTYTNPIVVVKPVSSNGGQGGVIQLKDINTTDFKLRYAEWDFYNDIHLGEQVFYLVAEAGSQTIAGLQVEAGKLNSSAVAPNGSLVTLSSAFISQPHAVFSAAQTSNDAEVATTRTRPVTSNSFELMMQEQELNTDGHAQETLGWIAIQQGSGRTTGRRGIEVFTTQVNHIARPVHFSLTSLIHPVVISDVMSLADLDPVSIRYRYVRAGSIGLYLHEEGSKDIEIVHPNEDVSIFVGQ